jgi:hypothetical protein
VPGEDSGDCPEHGEKQAGDARCVLCNGSGRVCGFGAQYVLVECPDCGGSGKKSPQP